MREIYDDEDAEGPEETGSQPAGTVHLPSIVVRGAGINRPWDLGHQDKKKSASTMENWIGFF